MLPMGVHTEQECWHHVSCLRHAHALDLGTTESPPSPRPHMPSHWVERITLASLGSPVFIDELWKEGKGLLQMGPQTVLAALLFGWDSPEKGRGHLQSCIPHPTRSLWADAGSPSPQERTGWELKPIWHGPLYRQSCLKAPASKWERSSGYKEQIYTMCISTQTAEYENTSQLRSVSLCC